MPCTPERLAANRRNALKSSGPRTAEGKDASRRNAYKHGLTGEGVALPDEEAAEVEARFAAFEADLKPGNDVARFLARRAAVLSVRMERCVRRESAGLALRMLSADADEGEARAREVEEHVFGLADDPARALRHLRRTPEGIDRLVSAWLRLRADLIHPDPDAWTPEHSDRLGCLLGHRPTGRPVAPSAEERIDVADLIDAEVARLRAERDGLDLGAIARARAAAPTRALFDPSREAELVRKYEAAAERGFYKALRDIERINAAESEQADTDPTEAHASTSVEVASFVPAPAPTPGPVPVEPESATRPPSAKRPSPTPAGLTDLERIPTAHFAEPAAFFAPIRE